MENIEKHYMPQLLENKIDDCFDAPQGTKVSELLGDKWKQWQDGQQILLNAPMGSGKSYFVSNVLIPNSSGKHILILSNRKKLHKQYKEYLGIESYEISKDINGCIVYAMCYQKLEDMICRGDDIMHYDYIVCDECHYFLVDAWNNSTDISWKWIQQQKDSIRLFMSATSGDVFMFDNMERNGNKELKRYSITPNYNYMKVHYFNGDGCRMVEYLLRNEDINENNKILYFSSNKEKAFRLYEDNKRIASITVSESDRQIKSTPDAFQDNKCSYILSIATSVIDNGIDIKDIGVKHIVCDMWNITTVIQCLGRKRMQDSEEVVNVYVRNWKRGELQGIINITRSILVNLNKVQEEYKNKTRINSLNDGFYYDKTKHEIKLNHLYKKYLELSIDKLRQYQQYIETPIIEDGVEIDTKIIDGYIAALQYELGLSEYYIIDIDKMTLQQELTNKLAKIKMVEYKGVQGRSKIAKIIGIKDGKGKPITSVNALNSYLEDNNISYRIDNYRTMRDGKKVMVYIVMEI